MPRLVLGPLLRYVDSSDATVWVQTDAPCEVEILGVRTPTFTVAGHHYAITVIRGLPAETELPYQVRLDGELCWPEPGGAFPPSVIRTLRPDGPRRITFGSCRITATHDTREDGLGADALVGLAHAIRDHPAEQWPELLLLLGDQVYADNPPESVRVLLRAKDGDDAQVTHYQEYARLYQDAWSAPAVRWLLSTVPSAMIFDDHEVVDDWNTSAAWKQQMRKQPWWAEGIVGALSSYWVYQHLGNLPPDEIVADPLFARVRASPDAEEVLREFARRADVDSATCRWSYHRELGAVRLVVLDSRAGRVLDEGRRDLLDAAEWAWADEHLRGGVEHLLIATSLPYALPHAVHTAESWNEAVCAGAWGRRAAAVSERLRRAIDLEHWAAFRASFDRLAATIAEVGRGERGAPPVRIVLLSGDIHCSYLAELDAGPGVRSALYQAVCSPMRHELPRGAARVLRAAWNPRVAAVFRWLGTRAGVAPDPIRWRLLRGPSFANAVMTIVNDPDRASLRLDSAAPGDLPGLRPQFTAELPATPLWSAGDRAGPAGHVQPIEE